MNTITTTVQFIRSQYSRLNRSSLRGFFALLQNKAYIKKFMPKHATIVEAGAHKGVDTAQMARLWPDAVIHAFEPVPELFTMLTKRTSRYPNVQRYQLALSDTDGFSKLYISEGTSDGSSSLLVPKEHLKIHPTVSFHKKIKVKTITIDSWAKHVKAKQIDFMWLDLQGMEWKVLKKSHIIFPKVKLLYTEINLKENYAGAGLYSEFKQWLISQGMIPLVENPYWNDMGNSLFIRRD